MLGLAAWQAYLIFTPPSKIIIAVAYFSENQGPPEELTVSNVIYDELKKIESTDPEVRIVQIPRVFVGGGATESARHEGNRRKATIVIWGDRSSAPPNFVTAHFEILREEDKAEPITIKRGVVEAATGAAESGKEVDREAISGRSDFVLTFGLEKDVAYFSAFTVGLIHYRNEKYEQAISDLELARRLAPQEPASPTRDVVLFYLVQFHKVNLNMLFGPWTDSLPVVGDRVKKCAQTGYLCGF